MVTEDLKRTPESWSFPDELLQAVEGIRKGKAFGFIIGTSSVMILSSPDNLHSIYIQNHEDTRGMPLLGATIKLHMNSLAWDKAWQTYPTQGSVSTVCGI